MKATRLLLREADEALSKPEQARREGRVPGTRSALAAVRRMSGAKWGLLADCSRNGVSSEDDLLWDARHPNPDDESTVRHSITCSSVLSCGTRRPGRLAGPAQAPHRSHRPRQHPQSRPAAPGDRTPPRCAALPPWNPGPFTNSPLEAGEQIRGHRRRTGEHLARRVAGRPRRGRGRRADLVR